MNLQELHCYVFYVTFGDPSCIGFWDIVRKKQTDTQTNEGKNRTPATAVDVGNKRTWSYWVDDDWSTFSATLKCEVETFLVFLSSFHQNDEVFTVCLHHDHYHQHHSIVHPQYKVAKYFDQRVYMYVCLSVCLSVCLLAYLKSPTMAIFKFSK